MQWLIYISIFAFLGITFYQDYKYRAVSWFLFPLLFTAFCALSIWEISAMNLLANLCVNLCVMSLIFGMITLYFSVKMKKLVNITEGMIGWGDILFLVCLCSLFSPANFIAFYVISLFGIVISSVIYKSWSGKKDLLIPLAGLQAILLMVVMAVNVVHPFFIYSNDEWLIFWLYA